FEEQLLASVQLDQPRCGKELWLVIAQRIGLADLMAVLDEFGDGQVWVPSRTGLMQELWVQTRYAEIQRLRHQEGLSCREVAERMKVSPATVIRAVRSQYGSETPSRGKPGR
ncbi:MAG TPA: helix-turn-helix domain-containing protein, partial [Frateuria sp.]|uniref:helix-turn-helix domain-containing protein n=1 Tax=Frateuria sp. TaxID=2211372 RepID=UPI002D7EEA23